MAHEPSSPRTSRPVRVLALVLATSFLAPLAVAREAPKAVPELRVGAARVDATWYVGSPAGQYASWGTAVHTDPPLQVDEHMVEPTAPANPPELTGRQVYVDPDPHATRRQPSYGVESRSDVRALVMESGTKRFAVVSADLYLPQQLLWSRIATILEERDRSVAAGGTPGPLTGISQENLALTVSHSHTSPYLSTPSWGVWTFQDVFDLRFFEWYAQKAAAAVVAAVSRLEPARVGAHRVSLGVLQRNSMGPAVADDGSPAGYPPGHNDISLDVIAFSGRRDTPIATWVVFGLHPEMLEGNDLLSGEYVHAMATIVDRALGAGHVTLFSQSNVGSSEPARGGILPPEARAEYSHRDYAQMRRAAGILASAVLGARADLAAGNGRVPFRSAVDLAYRTEWYAPPGLRFVPTVSNCRSDRALDADPPIPLVGLPDCVYPAQEVGAPRPSWPFDPGVTVRALREAGIPVPDNVGFPSLTGLEEAPAVPLQALRLGTVAVTFCPCEQFADQALNIKHRLERVIDALPAPPTGWDWRSGQTPWGFDWARAKTPGGRDFCIPQGAGATRTWRCADPRDPSRDLPAISDVVYRRMRAHVLNDASGWDDPSRSLESESEPPDPDEIRGNFTHERLVGRGRFVGYDLVSTVSMANDYWGYIVTYREFQRGDHYRKALTGLGPHAADFLATRLARIAAGLSDPEIKPPRTPKDDTYAVAGPAYARNLARAAGALAAATVPAREASLPRDGGTPRIVRQPDDVERFSAASMTWIGGSNSFDVPDVVIERQVGNRFVPVADTNADVQIRVVFPTPAELASWRTGSFEGRWTATFETYASDVALPDLLGKWHNATPVGVYRMVVVGRRHLGAGRTEPYRLVSRPFRVLPWRGISVEAIRADADGVTVDPGPTHQVRYGVPSDPYLVGPIDYPDTYASPFRFIRGVRTLVTYGLASPERHQQFCFTCSFEPWVDAGSPQRILVTVLRRSGTREVVEAHRRGEGPLAVWFAAVALEPGDKAFVDAGAIVDAFGNTNAHPSRTVERT